MKGLFSTLVASTLIAATAVSFGAGDAIAQGNSGGGGGGSASTDCAAGGVGLLEYAACVTASGNDVGDKGTLLSGLQSGSLFSGFDTSAFEWSVVGKSDEGNNPLSAGKKSTGSWSLSGLNLTGPFVVSLKAGNEYSAYYFNNVTEAINSGTFSTANGKDLSHMTIAAATTPGTPSTGTPEPFSMIGAGLAIGAGAWMKKRNNKA
ncbi:PEP-CTERM sorting domain-containing protein [Spirulina sp. CCNP1310]|uniref:PEP-CTERM sorting domain-containing protein n=1 Tax=Spirulina sp. CCNP1310 TaxID=3110249 RepID=UPI002B207F3D|nr:PEP-CTERM sorting domain-containing protein [Spirulina sp. CCNP1310]MEA5418143.1 PEP-CTERM sorting domain-containing protein [Spirulina sp. CCNP1310]